MTKCQLAEQRQSNATVCLGNNGGQIKLIGSVGKVVGWESSIDGTNWLPIANASTAQAYFNLTQTTQFRAILQNGTTCPLVPSTATTITVVPPPPVAIAGLDDEICSQTTYQLNGNDPSPSGATGLWSEISGPPGAVFTDASKPNCTVTNLQPGNIYQFQWTISGSASCPPSSDVVTITDDKAPIGGTTSSDATVCAGSNGGKITLSGQFGNVVRWEYKDSGPWTPILNTSGAQAYSNLTQTTQYHAIIHNGSVCTDVASAPTTITVVQPPPVANAGTGAEICNQTTFTLQGNDPTPATGLWTVVSGQPGAQFADATKGITAVSNLVPGSTYQFQWTITGSASCPPSYDIVTIIVDKPPVGGLTSGTAEVCSGNNAGQITLSGQFGSVVRWEYNDSGSWLPVTNTNTSLPYLNLTQTTQFRAILHNGSICLDVPSTPTTITVDPAPVQADAGADDEVCNVTSYTLHANNASPGTGMWSQAGGPVGASFTSLSDPNATVSGLQPGNIYQFKWTITGAASCPPTTDLVDITVDKAPVGGITLSDATVCSGSNTGRLTLSGQFGSIVRWEYSTNGNDWLPIADANSSLTYFNLTQTTYYRAVLHNSPTCQDVTSLPATITVVLPPIEADAGPDDEICSQTFYNLNGNTPPSGTGLWTVLSGPSGATFANAASPASRVDGLIPGSVYQFKWTITGSSSCPPTSDIVAITVDKAPVGGIVSSPADVCLGSNAGTLLLTGQYGSVVKWEFSTGNGWQPIANTQTTLHYQNLTQTTQYRAWVHTTAICGDVASAPVTITVEPAPLASIPGPDVVLCNVTQYTMHANNPAPGTGLWTQVQGPVGAVFSDATDPTATVSKLLPGNIYQFKWTITGTSTACPPSSGVVTVSIDQAPVGGTTASDATVCWGTNGGQITLSGYFGTIVRWESSTDGTTWLPIANSTPVQLYTSLTTTTQYRAMLHNGTSCQDVPSTPTTITVNPATPIAQAGPDLDLCNQTTVTLSGSNPGSFKGHWVQTAGPTVAIVDPTFYATQVTGLTGGNTYTFQWTIFGLPPCVDTQSSVNISVHTDIVPSFTMDNTHGCGPVTVTFTNTSPGASAGTFVWNFGDGSPTITTVTPPSHIFPVSSDGTEKTYTISMTPVSNCGSQTPFIAQVKVSPLTPIAALLPSQLGTCGTFTLTAKNLSPGNNPHYDFYLVDPKGGIVQHLSYPDNEDAVFQPITPTIQTDYSLYVIATDQCGNQAKSDPIIISAAPSTIVSQLQIKGDIQSVCLGSSVSFQNISTGGNSFVITVYDSNKNPILTLPSGTNDVDYTPPAIGNYYVSITASNEGCGTAPPSTLKEFTVYPIPQPSFTYNGDKDYNVTFSNTTPGEGNIPAASINYQWDFGDGTPKENAYLPAVHNFDFNKSPFTVTLTATTPGTTCAAITTQIIEIKFHGNLFLPNAFVPASSNKQLNTYYAKGYGLRKFKMQIFNNFGQMIWETTKLDANGSPIEGWDGTYKGQIVEQGVYVWQISATLLNGEEWKGMSYNNGSPRTVGVIHLIR